MTIIALDIATVTGFALLKPDGKIHHGIFDAHLRKQDKSGQRWIRFRRWFADMHAQNQFTHVHFEDCVILSGPGQTNTARIYGGFVATVETFCEFAAIPYTMHKIQVWKKNFTGNGAAKKEQVIQVCRQLGFAPQDDNAADALGILHHALDRCPILTPSNPAPKVKRGKKLPPLPTDNQPF